MNHPGTETKILIVGGGFAGIRAALDLAQLRLKNTRIILISDKPHFEYHATLYRVLTGRSPRAVCVPLRDVFAGRDVEVLEDEITRVDLAAKTLTGASGSHYRYDFLVLALGSETAYFDIPGLAERAFAFKSITDALRLKNHLHKIITEPNAQIVVVGGGATGVEVSGELSSYVKMLAASHHLATKNITIDLIEAAPRLVPSLPERASQKIKQRLQRLGVNIFLGRAVLREDMDHLYLKDMELSTKTVIWTAGVRPHRLYAQTDGLPLDKKGRVIVNSNLEARGLPAVFVVGDGAATPHTGMAQTATSDGRFIARVIAAKLNHKSVPPYQPKKPYLSIPVGSGWAATLLGHLALYGRIAWWLRRAADLRFFLSILPLRKALLAFSSETTLCESCSICEPPALPAERKGGENQ